LAFSRCDCELATYVAVEREVFLRAFDLKTDGLIADLRQTVRDMEASLAADNWRAYVDLNTKFHSLVVDAARSAASHGYIRHCLQSFACAA
jgi:DNA-binding GntR family transcriptional regulator